MEQLTLVAEKRDENGTKSARLLRKTGKIPATVYGLGKEAITLAINKQDLFDLLDKTAGTASVITLLVPGVIEDTSIGAIIRDIQWSPVHKEPLNVDLFWVSMTAKLIVTIPVELVGTAPGVEAGGSLNQIRYDVEIECTPLTMPSSLTLSIDGMEIYDTRFTGDIELPEGSELITDPEEPIVSVARPITEEDLEVRTDEDADLEDLELAEGEEGEEGEGDEVAPEDAAEESENAE